MSGSTERPEARPEARPKTLQGLRSALRWARCVRARGFMRVRVTRALTRTRCLLYHDMLSVNKESQAGGEAKSISLL